MKKLTQFETYKRLRKFFTRNPGTIIQKDKCRKNRQKLKIDLKKEL